MNADNTANCEIVGGHPPPLQLNLHFGPIEHGTVIVAGRPLHKGLEATLDAAIENHPAIGNDLYRLIEIEFIRGQEKRERGDAFRCCLYRISIPDEIHAALRLWPRE